MRRIIAADVEKNNMKLVSARTGFNARCARFGYTKTAVNLKTRVRNVVEEKNYCKKIRNKTKNYEKN